LDNYAPFFPSHRFWSFPLANIKSAKKRARQAVKRNERNTGARSALRTAIKKVVKAIELKDKAGAEAALRSAEPILDRSGARGLVHKNKVARHKSRLTAHIRALA
jgi:small subunit ribosomal protein S20